MFKKSIFLFIFIIIITFFYLVVLKYLSETNKKNINKNRNNINKKIFEKTSHLPILNNDTNNIIEFNSGFSTYNKIKTKRKFWELIK